MNERQHRFSWMVVEADAKLTHEPAQAFLSPPIAKKIILADQPEIAVRPSRVILKHVRRPSLLLEVSEGSEKTGFAEMNLIAFTVMQRTVAPMRI
ncbi:hypothetical protein [Pseudomonas vranovensis]|uniref:hypothetical protein n=1 Tax=Pseudomonas TaxID=286 RepID=UPI001304DEDB